jgi:hypothetical protein
VSPVYGTPSPLPRETQATLEGQRMNGTRVSDATILSRLTHTRNVAGVVNETIVPLDRMAVVLPRRNIINSSRSTVRAVQRLRIAGRIGSFVVGVKMHPGEFLR